MIKKNNKGDNKMWLDEIIISNQKKEEALSRLENLKKEIEMVLPTIKTMKELKSLECTKVNSKQSEFSSILSLLRHASSKDRAEVGIAAQSFLLTVRAMIESKKDYLQSEK